MYDSYDADTCHELLGRSLSRALLVYEGYPCIVLRLDFISAFITRSNPNVVDLRNALNVFLNARFRYFLSQNCHVLSIPLDDVNQYIYEGRAKISFRRMMVSNPDDSQPFH